MSCAVDKTWTAGAATLRATRSSRASTRGEKDRVFRLLIIALLPGKSWAIDGNVVHVRSSSPDPANAARSYSSYQ
jgi:hypothetical protein